MLEKELEMPKELYDMCNEEYETKWTNGRVKIKRFLAKELGAIQNASVKVKSSNGLTPSADINPVELRFQSVLKGVVEAPWGVNNIDAIYNLPPQVLDWVFTELDEFNTVSYKKKD